MLEQGLSRDGACPFACLCQLRRTQGQTTVGYLAALCISYRAFAIFYRGFATGVSLDSFKDRSFKYIPGIYIQVPYMPMTTCVNFVIASSAIFERSLSVKGSASRWPIGTASFALSGCIL